MRSVGGYQFEATYTLTTERAVWSLHERLTLANPILKPDTIMFDEMGIYRCFGCLFNVHKLPRQNVKDCRQVKLH